MGNAELYKNKFRPESARLKGWDYSWPGYYFITICTKNSECCFGNVEDKQMKLNYLGEIAKQEWLKSSEIRKEIELDEFIVMPNHIHGIVIITDTIGTDARPCVCTKDVETSEISGTGIAYRVPKSISSFIAGYKSTVTKQVNEIRKTPGMPLWQPRFHDRIIRDEVELYNVINYIKNNPAKWDEDEYFYK